MGYEVLRENGPSIGSRAGEKAARLKNQLQSRSSVLFALDRTGTAVKGTWFRAGDPFSQHGLWLFWNSLSRARVNL